MDRARGTLAGSGRAIAAVGVVAIAWWIVAALVDPSHLAQAARLGPLVGLVLIGVGGVAAQLLRNPAALIGTLVSLVLGGFLLVLSTTSLRGLTPGPGQPPARPELLSFAGGLVFVAIALALIVKGPRQAENRG